MATINETWTHADTANTVSADHNWTVFTQSGWTSTFHISGNQVTGATANTNYGATCDDLAATDDYTLEVDIGTGTAIGSGQCRLLGRVVDYRNYFEFAWQGSGCYIARTVNGSKSVVTSVNATQGAPAVGARMRFEIKGTSYKGYIRPAGSSTWSGVLASYTDTVNFTTGKKWGVALYANAATVFLDNASCVDFPNHLVVSTPVPVGYKKSLGGPKPAVVRISAIPTSGTDLVIPISTVGSTATAGTEYTALPATVTIPGGQPSVDVSVTPLVQTGVYAPQRTVRVTPEPVGGYVIDPTPYGEVTIREIERGKFGGIVGCAPTSILRFTNSDGKHVVNDPATGPVGYYRIGLIGDRYVMVDPEGWCLLPRGVWGAADATIADGSSGSIFHNGVVQNIGFDPGRHSNLENYYGTNEVAPRLTRLGFNFFGGYSPAAMSWTSPRLGVSVTAGSPNGVVPTQRKDSPDRKPFEYFISHQKQAMRWGMVKNIAAGITGNRKFIGPSYMPDVFDDPDVVPGAPGRYKTACDGTVPNLIRDTNIATTNAQWETNWTGDPEYPPPYTNPWMIYVDMWERDWLCGQAEYHRHLGYSVFCSPPSYTSYVDPGGVTRTLTGADQTNYSKIAFSNWLKTKYTTIGALNAAWATDNFYTTFDSAGGYGVGTGVLDEDGKKSWLGWNGSSAEGVSLSTCSQTVRDDLDDLMEYFFEQLFRLTCAGMRAACPNVLLFCPASDDETPWRFTKVASQYIDMGGSNRDAGGGSYQPVTAATYGLTLSATSGNPVTVTATSGTPFSRSNVGRLIRAGTGYGIIQRYLDSTHVEMEVLSAFASTSIGAGQWFLLGKSVSAWLKYQLPGLSWMTIMCAESQYPANITDPNLDYLGTKFNRGASYYGFPNGAATQADRASIYRQVMFDRFNAQSPDGKYYDLGIDWWQWAGRINESKDFGLIALSDDMLDGVERPGWGNFVDPVAVTNDELDFLLLTAGSSAAPPPPAITGSYHNGDTAVNGTGLVGATVTVLKGGVSQGTAVVAGDGTWTKAVSALATNNVLTATQTTGAGTSIPSAAVIVLAATLATPAISGTYAERDTVVTGTGVAGATLTLTVTPSGGSPLDVGAVTVAPDGNWSVTVPFQLLEDDDLTAGQVLAGVPSAAAGPVTVNGPTPPRIRVQVLRFLPGARIEAVLRAVVPRSEMARYADPTKRPLHPRTTDPVALEGIRTGRVLERRIVRSAENVLTQAQLETLLEAEWTTFQAAVTASNTTGSDGVEGVDTTWDGTSWQ